MLMIELPIIVIYKNYYPQQKIKLEILIQIK